MATFFTGEVIGFWSYQSNSIYANLTGTVTRSGNTVTLSNMSLYMETAVYSTGSDAYSFTVNGTQTDFTIYADGTNVLGSYALNNTSFSVTAGQTSASITWSSADGNYGAFTVTFPSGYTAPTTPTISGSNTSSTSNTIVYGTTSYGNPSTGTITLYGGTSPNPTTQIDYSTSTGNITFTHTGLTSNTTYYYRAKANNTQLDSNYSTEISVTTADAGKLYGSVNGQTKRIVKLYGSVNGQTKEIKKLYGSVNGQTKRIY